MKKEDDKLSFLTSKSNQGGLMYNSGGAKSIWEPQVTAKKAPSEADAL